MKKCTVHWHGHNSIISVCARWFVIKCCSRVWAGVPCRQSPVQRAHSWNRGPCSPLCPDRSARLPHKSVSPRGRMACLLSYLSSPTPTRRVTCRFKRHHICWCHVGAWPTPSADHSSLPSLPFLSTSSLSVPVSSSISPDLTDWLSVFFFLIYISV